MRRSNTPFLLPLSCPFSSRGSKRQRARHTRPSWGCDARTRDVGVASPTNSSSRNREVVAIASRRPGNQALTRGATRGRAHRVAWRVRRSPLSRACAAIWGRTARRRLAMGGTPWIRGFTRTGVSARQWRLVAPQRVSRCRQVQKSCHGSFFRRWSRWRRFTTVQ
jgi:hypothetical protein